MMNPLDLPATTLIDKLAADPEFLKHGTSLTLKPQFEDEAAREIRRARLREWSFAVGAVQGKHILRHAKERAARSPYPAGDQDAWLTLISYRRNFPGAFVISSLGRELRRARRYGIED